MELPKEMRTGIHKKNISCLFPILTPQNRECQKIFAKIPTFTLNKKVLICYQVLT